MVEKNQFKVEVPTRKTRGEKEFQAPDAISSEGKFTEVLDTHLNRDIVVMTLFVKLLMFLKGDKIRIQRHSGRNSKANEVIDC